MTGRKCSYQGCNRPAEINMSDAGPEPGAYWLCSEHAQALVSHATDVVNVEEERADHIRDGGKVQ